MAENKSLLERRILVVAIVLFAFVSALGIAFYYSSLKNVLPVAVEPTAEPTIIPTPMVIDVDVSDWKTYRNELYSYEFKYPSNILLNSYNDVGDEIKIANDTTNVGAQYNNKKGVIFSVRGVNIPLTFDGISGQFGATNKENIDIAPTQIAGVDGYQVVLKKTEIANNEKILSDIYFIKKGEQVLQLNVLRNDEITSKMLSTFKFIN